MVIENFSSLRSNGMSAVIQKGEYGIHAAEWWNGEGADFTFESKETDRIITKRIDLHFDEIENLITAAIAMGFVDIDTCNKKAKAMKKQNLKSQKTIKKLVSDMKI